MPSKEFDQVFQSLIKEMLEVAYEFVGFNDSEIDTLYLLGCMEDGVEANFFFKTKGVVVPKHTVNEYMQRPVDVSQERQFQALHLEVELLTTLAQEFEKDEREVPTLIKVTYQTKSGKMDCKLSYKKFLVDEEFGSFYDLYSSWMDDERE